MSIDFPSDILKTNHSGHEIIHKAGIRPVGTMWAMSHSLQQCVTGLVNKITKQSGDDSLIFIPEEIYDALVAAIEKDNKFRFFNYVVQQFAGLKAPRFGGKLDIDATSDSTNFWLFEAVLPKRKYKYAAIAGKILDALKVQAVEDPTSFNTTLSSLIRKGQWPLSGEILNTMKWTAVKDPKSFNEVIQWLIHEGEGEKARQIFEAMSHEAVNDPKSFNRTIILFLSSKVYFNLGIFDVLKGQAVGDVRSFNYVIINLARIGKSSPALKILDAVKEQAVKHPDSFNQAIDILIYTGQGYGALKILDAVKEQAVKDPYSFNYAILAFAQKKVRGAKNILDAVQVMAKQDLASYNQAIRSFNF